MTMAAHDSLDFLRSISGFTRSESGSSADRPIRLAVVDPAYSPWTLLPNAPAPARVKFEGETTLSTKAYTYAGGYIPWPSDRVFMVPIGNTYVIGGRVGVQQPQGFWQNAAGTSSGVEFGDGSYYDDTDGLVVAGTGSFTGVVMVNNGKPVITTPPGMLQPAGMGSASTTSATFVDVAAPSSCSITKVHTSAQTQLEIFIGAGCRRTGTDAITTMQFGVRVNGTDYNMAQMELRTLGVHDNVSAFRTVSGMAAGAYTVQLRYRRTGGTGTVTTDGTDWISMMVREVPL